MHLHDGNRVDFSHMLAVSFAGFVAVGNALSHRHAASTQVEKDHNIIPKIERTESGRVGKFEKFSHYVARQMGFEDPEEVPGLCKLANDFLKKAKDCEESIYEYFDKEDGAGSLYEMLIHEFDRCILTYLAFHWNQAPAVISQALSSESGKKTKLKEMMLAATSESTKATYEEPKGWRIEGDQTSDDTAIRKWANHVSLISHQCDSRYIS